MRKLKSRNAIWKRNGNGPPIKERFKWKRKLRRVSRREAVAWKRTKIDNNKSGQGVPFHRPLMISCFFFPLPTSSLPFFIYRSLAFCTSHLAFTLAGRCRWQSVTNDTVQNIISISCLTIDYMHKLVGWLDLMIRFILRNISLYPETANHTQLRNLVQTTCKQKWIECRTCVLHAQTTLIHNPSSNLFFFRCCWSPSFSLPCPSFIYSFLSFWFSVED